MSPLKLSTEIDNHSLNNIRLTNESIDINAPSADRTAHKESSPVGDLFRSESESNFFFRESPPKSCELLERNKSIWMIERTKNKISNRSKRARSLRFRPRTFLRFIVLVQRVPRSLTTVLGA